MTIRLACVSTAPNTTEILEHLARIAADELEVVLHLGQTDADHKASALSKLNTRKGTRPHLMDENRYQGANLPMIAHPDFAKDAAQFVDHMHRNAESFSFRAHNIRATQDYIDYYHIISDTVADALIRDGVTHVLFFNVPHLSYDTVVYHTAKALGLETLMVSQSLFPGKFFSLRSPEDFGAVPTGSGAGFEAGFEAAPYPIAKGQPLDLFYMKQIGQARGETGRISARAVLQLFAYLATRAPLRALNPFWMMRTIKRMQKIYGALPDWRDPFAKFFHTNDLAYFEHILQFEETPVDLEARFVYFAMQLQPEMTTSALGGAYRDQALAIEHLSRILPKGVKIYVKENPKQRTYMRGPMFFHRLRRIENVQIVPSFTDTHALSDRAEFVATISGTVGWEAVCKGKRALVFGNAWYRSLPGVTKFHPAVTYDEIAQADLDHADLEARTGTLVGRMHDGVVDRHYVKLVDGHDAQANKDVVARKLLALLKGETETVFAASGDE